MSQIKPDAIIDRERYKALVDESEELAIYFLSPTGVVETWDRAAEKFKQYKPHEVIGKHMSMFYTKEDQDRDLVGLELEEAKRNGRFEGGGWRVRKDGTRFWADVIISCMKDEHGNVTGFVKVARDGSEKRKQAEIIERQNYDLIELSTPVMLLWEGILVLPIIGALDSHRSQIVMERLLAAIVANRATVAILDIAGVPCVDTAVAQHLMKTMEAARLMGADCIISGIRPEIALTMVHLGIDLTMVKTKASMARALEEALAVKGLAIKRKTTKE
jgi:PAS domain S-box-containing protein